MEANFGIDTGLLITGSIWLMIAAYMVRFMAVAFEHLRIRAGHAEPPTSMPSPARSATAPRRCSGVSTCRLLQPSILTALLIVFGPT